MLLTAITQRQRPLGPCCRAVRASDAVCSSAITIVAIVAASIEQATLGGIVCLLKQNIFRGISGDVRPQTKTGQHLCIYSREVSPVHNHHFKAEMQVQQVKPTSSTSLLPKLLVQ